MAETLQEKHFMAKVQNYKEELDAYFGTKETQSEKS